MDKPLNLELRDEAACHTGRVSELLEKAAERIEDLEEGLLLDGLEKLVNGSVQG